MHKRMAKNKFVLRVYNLINLFHSMEDNTEKFDKKLLKIDIDD